MVLRFEMSSSLLRAQLHVYWNVEVFQEGDRRKIDNSTFLLT